MMDILTKIAPLIGILVLSATCTMAQDAHFRILHFTIDGQNIDEFCVSFLVGKNVYVAKRHNDVIQVPKEVGIAGAVSIQFEAGGDKFAFGPFGGFGYLEGDEIKEDFSVAVTKHPELGCSRYVLTRVPVVRKGSEKLANLVNFIVNNRCAKVKP